MEPTTSPTQPQVPTPTPQTEVQSVNNPGKVLGIVGIVLFFFAPVIGLVLSIISMVKSQKAGQPTVLGIVGTVMNAIGILLSGIILLLVMTSYAGIQQRAKLSASTTYANSTIAQVEAFHAMHGDYPSSLSEFKNDPDTRLDPKTVFVDSELSSPPAVPSSLAYYVCGRPGSAAGAKVGYWDYAQNRVAYKYSLDIDEKSVCTLSAN